MTTQILFLGCGKMGSILANNLIEESGFEPKQIKILKPSAKNKISHFQYVKTAADLPKNYAADLVFIAIKPQDAAEILNDFAKQKIFHKKTIFISILAGKKIKFFENFFGKNAKIIRAMPNLPIQYSQGILPYFANKNLVKAELKNLEKIFHNFGSAFLLDDEKYFDIVTAIFGCGPAYIFLLQEIFSEIAISHGIKKDKASQLVKKLLLGSALMSEFSSEDFSTLYKSVASKKGATEAALEILQKKSSLKNIFTKAIDAAVKRSQALSNS
jgi:pyrroline-5-carboxylate reductase